MATATESQAFAVETLFIRAVAPECNRADAGADRLQRGRGVLLRPSAKAGRRPPLYLRQAARTTSLWSLLVF
eukprot:7429518-Pyramimonas_sp.AAC.1